MRIESSPTPVTPVKKAAAVSTLRISLPASTASPAEARRQVSRFAAENDLLDRAGVALLVLSELVTNAVLYGGEPIQVLVKSAGNTLRIEVSDGDSDAAGVVVPQTRRADQPGGRGLHIVNALAKRWGAKENDDGKTVWADVGLDDGTDD
jgi:anti-sigma regulatory factor (Ser/Thr protein kinase)